MAEMNERDRAGDRAGRAVLADLDRLIDMTDHLEVARQKVLAAGRVMLTLDDEGKREDVRAAEAIKPAAKWLLNQYSPPAGAYPISRPLPGEPSTPCGSGPRLVRLGLFPGKNLLEPEPAPLIITITYLLCLSQESGREIGQFQLKRPLLYD